MWCSSNEKLYSSKVSDLVAREYKKMNSIKNGRYRYELVGETQIEIERLEVVAFIYPFH